MKSERRHELQHNDLAEWAIKAYESASPYRNLIIGIAVLLVVSAISWSVWHSHWEAQAAEGWNTVEIPDALYYPAYTIDRYAAAMDDASRKFSGTPAGEWARVLTADSCVALGLDELMKNKDQGTQRLNLALEAYKSSLDSSDSMARERAMFGTAKILESMGKRTEATAAYKELNKNFPKGTYTAIASERLERLAKPDTIELYKALADYTPKPAKEGPRGKLEGIGSLPDNPDESIKPGASSSGTGASVPKASAASSSSAPKSETPKSTASEPTFPKSEAPKSTASEPVAPTLEAPKSTASEPVAPKLEAPKSTSTAPVKKD